MPVVTLVKPMRLQQPGGSIYQYGVGQYWFDGLSGYDWYVMAHTANGRPELDSVRITDPGPPVVLTNPVPPQ